MAPGQQNARPHLARKRVQPRFPQSCQVPGVSRVY
jgi:hypothetical protein